LSRLHMSQSQRYRSNIAVCNPDFVQEKGVC
jgi:hypothetical protein